jgi:signal transduction histidine kinase
MGNCLRYAKNEVTVCTAYYENCFEISIRDDGTGFDEEALKNIFTRFYKGKNGNTGLGLAITKSIIEGHNGTVTAQNSPDGGAMFNIKLPVS